MKFVLSYMILLTTLFLITLPSVWSQDDEPCQAEQEALQACVDRIFLDTPPADDSNKAQQEYEASTLESYNEEDECSDEIAELESCLLENGTDDDDDSTNNRIRNCGYLYLPFWQTCVFAWNSVLSCTSCDNILLLPDKSCNEYETNTCERKSCCKKCDNYLLKDYINCVERVSECDADLSSCKPKKKFDPIEWFGISAGIVIGVIILFILVCWCRSVQQKKAAQEETSPPVAVATGKAPVPPPATTKEEASAPSVAVATGKAPIPPGGDEVNTPKAKDPRPAADDPPGRIN